MYSNMFWNVLPGIHGPIIRFEQKITMDWLVSWCFVVRGYMQSSQQHWCRGFHYEDDEDWDPIPRGHASALPLSADRSLAVLVVLVVLKHQLMATTTWWLFRDAFPIARFGKAQGVKVSQRQGHTCDLSSSFPKMFRKQSLKVLFADCISSNIYTVPCLFPY